MRNYTQGKFKPNNPTKYQGDITNIVYRSSWEMAYMCSLDRDSNVVRWSSEEVVINYISPVDGMYHRYFVDFKVKYKDGSVALIEIKPASQCKMPKKPKRMSKKFLTEAMEWGKNQAKWAAATSYAEERGWEFRVLTEKDLGIGPK